MKKSLTTSLEILLTLLLWRYTAGVLVVFWGLTRLYRFYFALIPRLCGVFSGFLAAVYSFVVAGSGRYTAPGYRSGPLRHT